MIATHRRPTPAERGSFLRGRVSGVRAAEAAAPVLFVDRISPAAQRRVAISELVRVGVGVRPSA